MKPVKAIGPALAFLCFPISMSYAQEDCETPKGRFSLDITDDVIQVLSGVDRNLDVVARQDDSAVIKVAYPKGSYDPKSMLELGKPVGGVNARIEFDRRYSCLYLDYALKFPADFDFVKGGKLPGLFGGVGNTGGRIPTGYDGFSARFLWLPNGGGSLYAYLPTSKVWGTALGKNLWSYSTGVWHHLTQKIKLNSPGKRDGQVQVWLDDELVYSNHEMTYRYDEELLIDGILFSTFFGGNNPAFASSKDTFVLLGNITISSYFAADR